MVKEFAPPELAAGAETVDVSASGIRFVYPFTFAGGTLDARAAAIGRVTWQGSHQALTVWRAQDFPTDDLLPHVADFLNPQPGGPRSTGRWRLDEEALRSPAGLGGGAGHPGAQWVLATPHGQIPFALESIELVLFHHGVGFLIVAATPVSNAADDWFDFIHYFRFSHGPRARAVSATRTVGVDATTGQPQTVPFVPAVASDGSSPDQSRAEAHFGTVLSALLRGASIQDDTADWWEDIYVPGMLIPHVALFLDGCPPERIDEHLYRLRNFFHARQEVHLSTADTDANSEALLRYAANQWFVFSLNGGGFLACNAPHTPFFRANLPEHLFTHYFTIFLLALMQRFVLMMLSRQVSREWVSADDVGREAQKAAAFSRIRDALLAFTAQGYFAQTMQQEHHHRCYGRWQEIFNLSRLYDEVSAEVSEMYSYLDLRQRTRAEAVAKQHQERTQNIERRLQLVGWLLGVPVWLFIALNSSPNVALIRHIFFGPIDVQGYDPLISVGIFVFGVALALIAYRIVRRASR